MHNLLICESDIQQQKSLNSLGMDFLHKCYATKDYQTVVVRFKFPNKLESKLEGRGSNPTRQVLYKRKANKMLSKGLGFDENLSYKEVSVEILDR